MPDISQAAIPPSQPTIRKEDMQHPLYDMYLSHMDFCIRKMIRASSFMEWLYQHEQTLILDNACNHPRYKEFIAWMHVHKGGQRPCLPSATLPEGLSFPNNFYHWLRGGIW